MSELNPLYMLLGGGLLGFLGLLLKNKLQVNSATEGQTKLQEKLTEIDKSEVKNTTLKEVENEKREEERHKLDEAKAQDVTTKQVVDYFNDFFDPNKRK